MIDLERSELVGCSDLTARRDMEAAGVVPYTLWERERSWREELQHVLDQILRSDPGAPLDWPSKPEAIEAGRRQIERMREDAAALERQLAGLRAEIEVERQRMAELGSLEYAGQPLEDYLGACRVHAIVRARARHGTVKAACRALRIPNTTYYRYCAQHGLT